MAGVVDGFEWACSGVYGLNADSLRGFLWDELVGVDINYVFNYIFFKN